LPVGNGIDDQINLENGPYLGAHEIGSQLEDGRILLTLTPY
jgi:hypothetical protein